MKTPLLSVACITYNHENYISQAIESWLMQKTDFDIEIIIGEDCSNDNTRAIIERYWQKYPDLIRVITSETNVGMMPNFIRTLEACQGKYIALCEGDDYWTDPLKLQKQVDFLENHSEYMLCSHNVDIINDGVDILSSSLSLSKDHYEFEELLGTSMAATCSFVFRNIFWKNNYLSIFLNSGSFSGDKILVCILAEQGPAKYLDDKMAIYRRHAGGVSLTKYFFSIQSTIVFLKYINAFYDYKYNSIVKDKLVMWYGRLAIHFRKEGFLLKSIKAIFSSIYYSRNYKSIKIFIKDYFLEYIFTKTYKVNPLEKYRENGME
jgi:glycosyltransferase involved in cell wall biosynthesis